MHHDWTPFQLPDWTDPFAEASSEALNLAGSGAQAYLAGGYRPEEVDVSSSLSGVDGKLVCVDEVNPCEPSSRKIRSDLSFCPETTGDAGSVVTPEKTKKHARHKYDHMIDPNLPPIQKKKQRRILANRESARRSRLKKKEALTHLLQREKELTQERDAAIAGLNQQIRLNVALRQQLHAMQSQLYHKGKLGAMIPQIYGEGDQPMSSADPFLMTLPTSDQSSLLDPCDAMIWNRSRL